MIHNLSEVSMLLGPSSHLRFALLCQPQGHTIFFLSRSKHEPNQIPSFGSLGRMTCWGFQENFCQPWQILDKYKGNKDNSKSIADSIV